MTIRFLSMAVLLLNFAMTHTCAVYESRGICRGNPRTEKPTGTPSPEHNAQVIIKSVEFYAWWWNEEQLKTKFDERNAPPKKAYIKLEQWKDTNNANVPHPNHIDVVCQIENEGNTPEDFVVSATGDWIVAPRSQYGEKNLNNLTDDVAWTEEATIGREDVRNLAPGEKREIKFKDFDLLKAIKSYSGDGSDTLWPWKFRVHIYIGNTNNQHFAQAQTILSVLPKDDEAGY